MHNSTCPTATKFTQTLTRNQINYPDLCSWLAFYSDGHPLFPADTRSSGSSGLARLAH